MLEVDSYREVESNEVIGMHEKRRLHSGWVVYRRSTVFGSYIGREKKSSERRSGSLIW